MKYEKAITQNSHEVSFEKTIWNWKMNYSLPDKVNLNNKMCISQHAGSSGLVCYVVCKSFTTLLWSLEYVIQNRSRERHYRGIINAL